MVWLASPFQVECGAALRAFFALPEADFLVGKIVSQKVSDKVVPQLFHLLYFQR